MKLRIRGNTLRLRLTRGEVDAVGTGELVEETLQVAPDARLTDAIEVRADTLLPSATFAGGRPTVIVPNELAAQWATSEQIGITAQVPNGAPGGLWISIEKDFACLHRESEDADAFPNPAAR
jgi:hypothetical protein